MRILLSALIVSGILALSHVAEAQQCVPYARQISGVGLSGDAWRWWSAAEGAYDRGNQPRNGAVLVFRQTSSMRHGHVAVVSRVINKREIRIDHANWGSYRAGGKGTIRRDVAVLDVSPHNDWTQVRVWHEPSDSFGARVNPTYGFIYARGSSPQPAATFERPVQKPVQAAALRVTAAPETVVAPAAPAPAVSAPAAPTPSANAPRHAADDLNRQVLAKLRAQRAEPAEAAKAIRNPGNPVATKASNVTKAPKVTKPPTVTKAKVIIGKRSVGALLQRDVKQGKAKR